MTGRPWYAFYPDAYERDAAHLSYVQDSAYRRMLDHYYKTGEPLSLDRETLYRACRAMKRDERAAVDMVLQAFFSKEDDGYHHRTQCAKHSCWERPYGQGLERRLPNDWRARRKAVFKRDGFRCGYCGAQKLNLECDHIFPASRGGTHEMSNLIAACRPCNRSKRDMTPTEWRNNKGAA